MTIKPYVTDKGGVVILNGPFKIDEACKIARLCWAAPELLEACKEAYKHLRVCDDHENTAVNHGSKAIELIEQAIAKADGK